MANKTQAEHLVEYVLERLTSGLAENEGLTGSALDSARQGDIAIALQRLVGALGGEACETRLIAMLGLRDEHRFGAQASAVAEARMCAEADATACEKAAAHA
jgi:hypothetical protein